MATRECTECTVGLNDPDWDCVHTLIWKGLEIGDVIEIQKNINNHWVIYIGDGDVVHLKAQVIPSFWSFASPSLTNPDLGQFSIDKLMDIASCCKCRVNNTSPRVGMRARDPQAIKVYALGKVIEYEGKSAPYKDWKKYTQQFVQECRFHSGD